MIFIGLDDTDTLESRGTGHLARLIAVELSADFDLLGVTRHQLLRDPRVPMTAKNSCAAIHLRGSGSADLTALAARVRALMLENFNSGSDPGLCVAGSVPQAVVQFGHKAQRSLMAQSEARAVATAHGLHLFGLGGTEDGVIGALAAVGLAATGEDGRYVLVGRSRELAGLRPVSALLEAGIAAVETPDGHPVAKGMVLADKLRPARRGGRSVAVVQRRDGYWLPLKLD
jgi:tRNA(Ile2) C34 agmatinyltransferase TiaS